MSYALRALVLALAGGLLVGCGEGGGQGGATDVFDDLPGVRDATVHKQALDTDYYGYTAVVDMEPDATTAEVVGALDALAAWRRGPGDGGDDRVRLYLGGGTTDIEDGGWGDGAHHGGPEAVIATAASHAKNVANTALLRRAVDVLDAPVTIRDYEWAVTTTDPAAVLRKVAADPELAAAPDVHLATADDTGADPWQRPAGFASTEPVTAAAVDTYEKAVANEALVRQGQAHVSFVGSSPGSEPALTDGHPGAMEIQMSLRLEGSAGPKALARDPLEDPRWPVVAAQLDLLRSLPDGSMLIVWLEHGPNDGGALRFSENLVEVITGTKLPKAPRWNAAAAAHLGR